MTTLKIGDRVRPVGEFAEAIGAAAEGVVLGVDTAEGVGEVVLVYWSGRGQMWVGESMIERDDAFRPPEGFEPFDEGSPAWEEYQRGGAVEIITYARTDQDFQQRFARPITIPMVQDERGVWVAEG